MREACSTMRVLVASAEERVRSALSGTLRREGHEVAAEGDVAAALARLRVGDVEVALFDILMPGLDAAEVVAAARGLPRAATVVLFPGFWRLGAAAPGRADVLDYLTRLLLDDEAVRAMRQALFGAGRPEQEAARRQAQKMEALGRLVAGVAHDFNNAMTVINGHVGALLRATAADDARRAALEEVRHAGERAAALSRQLLGFSRPRPPAPRALDLNAVVAGLLGLVRRSVGEHIVVAVELATDPGRVRADQGHLEHVLLELALRAREAVPAGGRIVLGTAAADTVSGRRVVLTVRAAAPRGRTAAVPLPEAVREIARQHGGEVGTESTPGGVLFTLSLPEFAGAEPPGPRSPRGGETLLLVEDDAPLRSLLASGLRRCGYSVVEAADGDEAARRSERDAGAVHLVVADVVMPKAGGAELARRLESKGLAPPFLYVSGYAASDLEGWGLLPRGVPFLQKPFTTEELATRVREVLDGKP